MGGEGRGGEGLRGGLLQQASHRIFLFFEKAVQQGSVAHAETLVGNGGDEGSAKVSRGQAGGGVSMEGVGSGPGLQTDS